MRIALIEEGSKIKSSEFDKVISFSEDSYVNVSDYLNLNDFNEIYDTVYSNLYLWIDQLSNKNSFIYSGTDILKAYGKELFDFFMNVCQKEYVVRKVIERESPTELWIIKNDRGDGIKHPNLDFFISDFIPSGISLKYFVQNQKENLRAVSFRGGQSYLIRISDLARNMLNNLRRSGKSNILIFSDLNKIPVLFESLNGRDVMFLREKIPLRFMPYIMKNGVNLKLLSDFKVSVGQKKNIGEQVNNFTDRLNSSTERIIIGSGDFTPYIKKYLTAVWRKELRHSLESILQAHVLFKKYRISSLLVDEDRSKLNNLLVQVASQYKCKSYVNGHGDPFHKIGVLPLSADYMFVWGKAQKKLLNEWGLEEGKILITGCSKYDKYLNTSSALVKKRICRDLKLSLSKPIVLIATCPLKTGRNIWKHIAWSKLEEILTTVDKIMGVQTIIKLHPGDNIELQVHKLLNRLNLNKIRVIKDYDSLSLAKGVDILIIYRSTFAIDGLAYQKPVILTDEYTMDKYETVNIFYDGTTQDKLADVLDSILNGLARRHIERWRAAANYCLNGMDKVASKDIASILTVPSAMDN